MTDRVIDRSAAAMAAAVLRAAHSQLIHRDGDGSVTALLAVAEALEGAETIVVIDRNRVS